MLFKRIIISLYLLPLFLSINYCQQAPGSNDLYIASWNVENFFDLLDDPNKNDDEFLPDGSKQWDEMKFERKVLNLSKVFKYMNEGKAPDVISLEEVENNVVCKYIAYEFQDRDYIICHRQSPDERGIDNALMYDRNVLDIVSIEQIEVKIPSGKPTRDILHVALKRKNSDDTLHFYVNHWPSRRGGQKESEPNRIAAAKVLRESVSNLRKESPSAEIIIMGDFNDEPADTSIQYVFGGGDGSMSNNNFINLAFKPYEEGFGTYYYRQDWNMLDQMLISRTFFDNKGYDYEEGSFEIIKPDFMITKEGKYKGSPIPTFGGKTYLGGYSDHYPIGMKIKYIPKN